MYASHMIGLVLEGFMRQKIETSFMTVMSRVQSKDAKLLFLSFGHWMEELTLLVCCYGNFCFVISYLVRLSIFLLFKIRINQPPI